MSATSGKDGVRSSQLREKMRTWPPVMRWICTNSDLDHFIMLTKHGDWLMIEILASSLCMRLVRAGALLQDPDGLRCEQQFCRCKAQDTGWPVFDKLLFTHLSQQLAAEAVHCGELRACTNTRAARSGLRSLLLVGGIAVGVSATV